MSFRPHIGLRHLTIKQSTEITHKGGSWTSFVDQPADYDIVKLNNDFKGIGPRIGLNLNWNLSCGISLFSEFAGTIAYGRFNVDHNESVYEAVSPFSKAKVLETKYQFHASRALMDLALGLEYSTLICDCDYGITVRLGWEKILFYHQNQMWRVVRIGSEDTNMTPFPSDTGENNLSQRRGILSTQGLNLSFKFDF